MTSLPAKAAYGLYSGALTGLVPATIAWPLGFSFRYITGVTMPGLVTVALSAAIASANGGLMTLADPTITQSESQVRLTVALLVVLIGSLYAHNRSDAFANDVPWKMSLRKLTEWSLSTDVAELVDGREQVSVTVTGEVGDIEGYPSALLDIHTGVHNGEWMFPANIPFVELESRFADRLQSKLDPATVEARLDEWARVTVTIVTSAGGLSKCLPVGKRAVSVATLVSMGPARGDDVVVVTDDSMVSVTVAGVDSVAEVLSGSNNDNDDADTPKATSRVPMAVGGESRITLAVDRGQAKPLLASGMERFAITSRGIRREFGLVSLLRRADKRFSRLSIRPENPFDDVTLDETGVRDAYGMAAFAVRYGGNQTITPREDQVVSVDDALYTVELRAGLTSFGEAIA